MIKAFAQHYRPAPTTVGAVVNGLLFNLSWLAIVLPHSSRWAPLVVILHLLVHFRFFGYGVAEARLVLIVTMMGLLLDQIFFLTRVFTVSGAPSLAPLWLSCLWPVLATTLMHSFGALQQRLLLAAVVGGVGGALTYMAGTRLSDVDFVSAVWGPVTMALTWAMLFPALLVGASLASGNGQHRDTA